MFETATKTGPAIDFHEQFAEFDLGQSPADGFSQVPHAGRTLLGHQGGQDQGAVFQAHRAVTARQQRLHLRQALPQLGFPFEQAGVHRFGHAELSADLGSQRGPLRDGDQVGFGIGVAAAAHHPEVTGTQRGFKLPQDA